jgi:hypothetical protein
MNSMIPLFPMKENLFQYEPLAKVGHSVIPAKAGIQNRLKSWIPGRASLARNDDFLLLSRVLQEPQFIKPPKRWFRKKLSRHRRD